MPSEDLTPYLKKGIHYSISEVLYRNIFEPILSLGDRIHAWFTRRWCEDNSLALREMKEAERLRSKRSY